MAGDDYYLWMTPSPGSAATASRSFISDLYAERLDPLASGPRQWFPLLPFLEGSMTTPPTLEDGNFRRTPRCASRRAGQPSGADAVARRPGVPPASPRARNSSTPAGQGRRDLWRDQVTATPAWWRCRCITSGAHHLYLPWLGGQTARRPGHSRRAGGALRRYVLPAISVRVELLERLQAFLERHPAVRKKARWVPAAI